MKDRPINSADLEYCASNAGVGSSNLSWVRRPSKEGGWDCKDCGLNFRTKHELYDHRHESHPESIGQGKNGPSKRGPFKIGGRCQFCGKEIRLHFGLVNHENHCSKNPNGIPIKSHQLNEETKNKISLSMKKAIKEGRTHGWANIYNHDSKRSYPERWWKSVIDNEFDDKNVLEQVHFHLYRLDFAWPDKMKCIEIDGRQHQECEKQVLSDIKKDQRLKEEGWELLRINWKECFNNPKKWIKIANEFIGR